MSIAFNVQAKATVTNQALGKRIGHRRLKNRNEQNSVGIKLQPKLGVVTFTPFSMKNVN